MKSESQPANAYDKVILSVFRKYWRKGADEACFTKDDLIDAATEHKLRVKNVADILYTYRSRRKLPAEMRARGHWLIEARGSGMYAFVLMPHSPIVSIPHHIKAYPIPYAVPDIVASNIATDEQGLLTIVRYNRLLDVFTGLACFHLQSHIRTQIAGHGQVEIDDLYVGVDKDGRGYVLPIEAKDKGEYLGIDKAVALTLFAKCRYPKLICRPLAVVREQVDQFVFVEFDPSQVLRKVEVRDMRRYLLVRDKSRAGGSRSPEK